MYLQQRLEVVVLIGGEVKTPEGGVLRNGKKYIFLEVRRHKKLNRQKPLLYPTENRQHKYYKGSASGEV